MATSVVIAGLFAFAWFGTLVWALRLQWRARREEDLIAELRARIETSERLREASEEQRRQLGEDAHRAQLHAARLETELQLVRNDEEKRLAAYQSAEARLSQSFEALAHNALRQSSEGFMQLARSVLEQHETRAKGDLELRHQAIHHLVQPLHMALDKVHERMGELEKQRVGAYQGLQEQVSLLLDAQRRIQLEASNLATALRAPNTRGRWGELQLKRVVELAGMLAYCDFYEQVTMQGEQRVMRPDMIVRLPGQRSLAIDAKVPLSAYLEAVDCQEPERHHQLMVQHAALVRKHVSSLSQKAYWEQLEQSPDFVLLYLPGEAIYSAALQADPSLLELGADHRVLIATPTSLIALLRATAFAWRQEDLAANAQEISRLGKELYQRIADLSSYVGDMGKSLQQSVGAYNKLVGNLESRVLVSARKFQDLKTDDQKKEIRRLEQIETAPRGLAALDEGL